MNNFKKCEICKKSFEKNYYDSKKVWGKKRFCSLICSAKDPARIIAREKMRETICNSFKNGRRIWNKGKKGLQVAWNKGNGEYAKKLGFGKWMKGRKGELSHVWKGEEVGYEALHDWVYRELGRPKKCTYCGLESDSPWKMHWANISNEYKRNLNDWIRLCAKCHKLFDKGRKQIKYARNLRH